MQEHQLEVKRANSRSFCRLPSRFNFWAVVSAVLLLIGLSFWTVVESRRLLKENIASKLETILEIEAEAVGQWLGSQKQIATFVAADHDLAEILKEESDEKPQQKLIELAKISNCETCLLMTVDGTVIASAGHRWLRDQADGFGDQFCETLLSGKVMISPVFSNLSNGDGEEYAILISAPIFDSQQQVVGFFGIGHNLSKALTEVLASSRSGKSGETVAVTAAGDLISQSRFPLAIDRPYKIEMESSTSVNLSGIADHHGESSVMATRWLPEFGMGLITKMSHGEANAPANRVLYFVWVLFSLVLLTACSTLFYRWYLLRLRERAKQSELSNRRLGAYDLEEKIGEGGMGIVYRARHALLRRPTAVKILPPEKSDRESIKRFENEVHFSSQLKHPNTISIYDYGRTEAGLFYYAMELLDGMSLDRLVELEGPLPDGRVIEILKQSCRSLEEAHLLGLVHRDIKPGNIMLCNRGGAVDTVKVLDFGMVRDRSSGNENDLLAGTPNYMAPECFTDPEKVDARVDIFALGAVAFFVLTGRTLFNASSLDKLLDLQILGANVIARQEFEKAITEDELLVCDELIELVCDCLGRLNDRPNSVGEVLERLTKSRSKIHWGRGSAEKWWASYPSQAIRNAALTAGTVGYSTNALDETQALIPRNSNSHERLKKEQQTARNN